MKKPLVLALFLVLGTVLLITSISGSADAGLEDSVEEEQAQEDDCSEPEDFNDQFLIERCNDGAYMINKETGEKNWVGTANGLGKACDTTEIYLISTLLQ